MEPVATTPSRSTASASEVFVAGEPVLFLSGNRSKEAAWTEAVRAAIATPIAHPHLRFVVGSLMRGGNPFDIDNLAHLVIVTAASNAQSVWVEVIQGQPPGVFISEAHPPETPNGCLTVHIGAPPSRSVKPPINAPELHGLEVFGKSDCPLGLSLAFDSAEARIWDFGFNGPIKPLIDALEPLLGRYRSGPMDHRIRELLITKGAGIGQGVTVALWPLEAHQP